MTQSNDQIDLENVDVNHMIAPKPPKPKEPLAARIISIILHPLFMGMYAVGLLFVYTDFKFVFANQILFFLAPFFILTFLIPANALFLLKKAHLIKDYDLKDRKERFLPFLIIFCCYALLFYYFYQAGLYVWFLSLLLAPLFLLIITAIISTFWKISAHMMGIGGLIGGVLSVCYNVKGLNPFFLFIILFILAGCLGVSRLILKRHTPAQVYTGFVIGLAVTYISVAIGVYINIILFSIYYN